MIQPRRFAIVAACALAAGLLVAPSFAVVAIGVGAAGASAQEMETRKPPLTKEQEREKFHPRVTGMDATTRLAGYAQRLEMEKSSPLQGLRFRNVGPEIQGGRIVDIEGIASRPDSLLVA